MTYYQDQDLLIRDMEPTDAQISDDEYTAQGWHPDVNYYHMRMREAAEDKCIALTAVYQGQPAGSVYLSFDAKEGAFKGRKIPEIVDFSVLQNTSAKASATG